MTGKADRRAIFAHKDCAISVFDRMRRWNQGRLPPTVNADS